MLVRELRHPPEKVWRALTDPEHLREWAPFDADRSLATVGAVKLSTVGRLRRWCRRRRSSGPTRRACSSTRGAATTCAGSWSRSARGTRLTLWHNIDRAYIAMGAAGWHICFDVLDRLLDGAPIGRIVGREAMKFDGWQRLHAEYGKQFST